MFSGWKVKSVHSDGQNLKFPVVFKSDEKIQKNLIKTGIFKQNLFLEKSLQKESNSQKKKRLYKWNVH